MDYDRRKIVKDEWTSIFDDAELDNVLKGMQYMDAINR